MNITGCVIGSQERQSVTAPLWGLWRNGTKKAFKTPADLRCGVLHTPTTRKTYVFLVITPPARSLKKSTRKPVRKTKQGFIPTRIFSCSNRNLMLALRRYSRMRRFSFLNVFPVPLHLNPLIEKVRRGSAREEGTEQDIGIKDQAHGRHSRHHQ